MDRNSIETLCCTIMRHAKKEGRVRLSRLMEYYGASDLAADVGLGDSLYGVRPDQHQVRLPFLRVPHCRPRARSARARDRDH